MSKRKIKKTTFEGLKTPSYEEIIGDINKRIGKRPNIPKSLPTGDWSKQALRILSERYLYKNDKGKVRQWAYEGNCVFWPLDK